MHQNMFFNFILSHFVMDYYVVTKTFYFQSSSSGDDIIFFESTSDNESEAKQNNLPYLIRLLITNAEKNTIGNRGNRYNVNEIMKIAMYIYIRGGRNLYGFFNLNLKLPVLKTVQRNMLQYHKMLSEGHLYFDELDTMLQNNNYPREVCILEDGTRLTEMVEYDAMTRSLIGLVSPIESTTGMPKEGNFPALTAQQIIDTLTHSTKAAYVQVILAKPNVAG